MIRINTFTKLAIGLGIASIIFSTSVLPGMCFGSLAIIFAYLSKGTDLKLNSITKVAVHLGLIGVIASIGIGANIVYRYKTDSNYRAELNKEFEKVYGKDINTYFDEYIDSFGL